MYFGFVTVGKKGKKKEEGEGFREVEERGFSGG